MDWIKTIQQLELVELLTTQVHMAVSQEKGGHWGPHAVTHGEMEPPSYREVRTGPTVIHRGRGNCLGLTWRTQMRVTTGGVHMSSTGTAADWTHRQWRWDEASGVLVMVPVRRRRSGAARQGPTGDAGRRSTAAADDGVRIAEEASATMAKRSGGLIWG
ncbi:hypothetical protein E2562_034343 [Oryza meyeriana var. granulata]|uniref:Uncharacterized protein n=1 Tax=Oryza meyeriana var. granulata TaxID=110450 RepID=A0A6G1BPI6_9ORYZ|nr:hypothetical protein E2562_034343 [Oryza meyeriana var. granulata]